MAVDTKVDSKSEDKSHKKATIVTEQPNNLKTWKIN